VSRIFSHIRYELDLSQLDAFQEYGRVWVGLIEKYGGEHLGYFLPRQSDRPKQISFPGVGQDAPDNIAIAIFSFPDWASYDDYRAAVANDPECTRMTEMVERTKCFTRYERSFLRSNGDD
jgi:hypothetical protein